VVHQLKLITKVQQCYFVSTVLATFVFPFLIVKKPVRLFEASDGIAANVHQLSAVPGFYIRLTGTASD
jgi:hypothetical protein